MLKANCLNVSVVLVFSVYGCVCVRRRESEWEFMSCATIFEILIGWSGLKLIVNAMVVGFVRQHAVKI